METEIIQISRLCLVNDLPRLIEALQGKSVNGEILIATSHPAQGA